MKTLNMRFTRPLAAALALVIPAALTIASPATAIDRAPAAIAAGEVAAENLVVAAGRLGSLRMGTSTQTAERLGWISRDSACLGWTAGPRSIKRTRDGYEVFKAYPEKVKAGKVLSMWATGEVITTKGIRTAGIGKSERRGSSLRAVGMAYPNLRMQGPWTDPASGLSATVYSAGNPRKGWLDFFISQETSRVWFVVVRTDDVRWRFPGADAC